MVASGQRAGFFDEGLQPFLEGVSLRGGAWHDLRFTMTPRKPRRHVLSDGHWRLEDKARARDVWRRGLAIFPDVAELRNRVNGTDAVVEKIVHDAVDPDTRVDTSLRGILP